MNHTTLKVTPSRIILSVLMMSLACFGLLTGIGGTYSVLWLVVAGFISLYLLGKLSTFALPINLKVAGLGLLAAYAGAAISGIMIHLLGSNLTANPLHVSGGTFLVTFALVIVPSLIGEEAFSAVFFVIGNYGTNRVVGGVILSTILFTLLHGPEYNWNILQLASIAVSRLIFTMVAMRSSFATSSLVHIAFDTTLFALTLL